MSIEEEKEESNASLPYVFNTNESKDTSSRSGRNSNSSSSGQSRDSTFSKSSINNQKIGPYENHSNESNADCIEDSKLSNSCENRLIENNIKTKNQLDDSPGDNYNKKIVVIDFIENQLWLSSNPKLVDSLKILKHQGSLGNSDNSYKSKLE
jgi:hypothetical protein